MDCVAYDDEGPFIHSFSVTLHCVFGEMVIGWPWDRIRKMGGEDVKQCLEVGGGGDARLVIRLPSFACLDEKTHHPRGGVVARMSKTIFDGIAKTGTQGHCCFEIGKDDLALGKLVLAEPGARHVCRGFGPSGDDGDVIDAEEIDESLKKASRLRIRQQH